MAGSFSRPIPRPARRRRRAAIIALLVAASAALALGIFPQDPLRRLAESQLRGALGPHSRIGQLHVVPARLSAELRDLVIEAPGYTLSVARVRLRAHPATLLGHTVSLALLEADRPQLTLRPQTPADPASRPPRLAIDRLDVSRLGFAYVEADKPLLAVEGVEAHGAIGSGPLEVSAPGATLDAGRPLALGPARARVRLSSDLELEVETSELRLGSSWASAHGSVGSLLDPELDLALEAVLHPEDARAAASGLVEPSTLELLAALEAPLQIEASAKGRPDAARVEAEARGLALGGALHANARAEGRRFQARLDWRGADLGRGRSVLQLDGPPLSGRLDARVSASGDPDRVELRADVGADAGASGLAHRLQASLSGSVDPATMGVDARYQASLDTRATASTAPLRSARLRVDGTVRGSRTPEVQGRVDGTLALRSPAGDETLQLGGELRAQGSAVRAEFQARGAASLQASLAANGSVVDSLRIEGRVADLARLAPAAHGRAELTLAASGPVAALDAEGRLAGENVAWNGVTVGPLTLSGRSERGNASLELALPEWRVAAEARVEHGRLSGSARLEDTPLEPFSALSPQRIGGSVAARVQFEAPLASPARAAVVADVTALELRSGDLAARAPHPFRLRFEGETLRLEDAALEGEGVAAQATGEARVSGALDLQARLRLDLARAPLPAPWTAAGVLESEMRVRGTPSQPKLTGFARVAELALTGGAGLAPLLRGAAELRFEGDRLTIAPSDLALAGGTLRLEGQLPLRALTHPGASEAGPLEVRAGFSDVAVPALAASFGAAAETPLAGTLAGELRLRGGASPRDLDGALELRASGLRAGELDVELQPVKATWRDGQLVVAPFELGSSGARLRSEAQLDLVRRVLSASSRGEVDLRALTPFVGAASLGGTARLDFSVAGPLDAPAGKGSAELEGVTIRARTLPQAITEGAGRVELDGSTIRVPGITARLGGGSLALEGSARIAKGGLSDVRLKATGRELSMRYPRDFKSRLAADLTLTGRTGDLVLGGQVRLERGLYDKDIDLEKELLAGATAPEPAAPVELPALGLDLQVETERAVLIRNNLGELNVTGRLQLRGDLSDPAPYGRFEIREGGKVFLQTREFVVERGALVYQGTLEPDIDVLARTQISQPGGDPIEITIAADGPLLAPTLELTSQPSYSEKEIASLIATGRRQVALDSTAWVAGEQAAALLAGRATRALERGFEPLGLDEVSIQPELLAREGDPSARFTFGKHLTPQLRLIYSIGLDDAEDRYVEGQYRVRIGREVSARLIRTGEGILTYGLGQRWAFGVPDRGRRTWRPRRTKLADVRVEGDLDADAARALRRRGDEVSAWELLEDSERLERRLRRDGHLEALVSSRLDEDVATYTVRAGPRYSAEVRGLPDAPDLADALSKALYEEEALEQGRTLLLDAARKRGHLWARVDTSVERSETERTLVFTVDSGPVVESLQVEFEGAHGLDRDALLTAAGGPGQLLTSAARAREGIAAAYRNHHYLEARVGAPRVDASPDRRRVRIQVPVDEGRRARLAAVRFEGSVELPETTLRERAQLVPGELPAPEALTAAGRRVREAYLERGFVDVRVRSRLSPEGSDLVAVFDVVPGEPATIGSIRITGLHRTREALVRRQIDVRPGDPLDPRRLAIIEKRLLDLGVFTRAVVTAGHEEPATVNVELEEDGPYTASYDVRFSQEERTTALVDVEAGNVAGLGLAVGGRYRVGRDLNEVRLSLHLPSLGRGGDTTASGFYQAEDFKLVRENESFGVLDETETQSGFQLQQAIHARRRWTVLGGFSFKNIRSRARTLDHDVSGLQASLVRESRDNPLDARKGSFLSLSLEGGGKWTLSDFEYFRVFAQGFGARAISRDLTWAQGLRIGLARGLEEQRDQQVSVFGRSTELFQAGGPTSLRGYALDSVGPPGPAHGVSRGGEALLVVNQELRYLHPWGIGAAVFYDVGNVFARVEDIDFTLRHSIGAGLRYQSPIGMLRIDVGFPLNRRPTDRAVQWFFALGQAF